MCREMGELGHKVFTHVLSVCGRGDSLSLASIETTFFFEAVLEVLPGVHCLRVLWVERPAILQMSPIRVLTIVKGVREGSVKPARDHEQHFKLRFDVEYNGIDVRNREGLGICQVLYPPVLRGS